MVRRLIVFAALLLLGGCETDEDFWQPYQNMVGSTWPFSDSQGEATVAAPQHTDAQCASVAEERAADAFANRYDDDAQSIVYSGTYADCAAWNKAHPQAPATDGDYQR